MENRTQVRGQSSKFRWAACGPDFRKYDPEWIDARVAEYGEICVRYAIHLVNGTYDFTGLRDDVEIFFIDKALAENWLSDVSQARILEFTLTHTLTEAGDRLMIPWLNLYFDELSDEELETIERLVGMSSVNPTTVAKKLLTENDTKNRKIMWSLIPTIHVHPDLRADTIIKWLEFIVRGHEDPRLKRAYEQVQPTRNLRDYDSYKTAHEKLWMDEVLH